MKFSVRGLIGDDSNQAWEWFGEHDPYYGVLSGAEYRKGNLSQDRLKEFFETGAVHVERIDALIKGHFGPRGAHNCLDFGSGVGRLVVPFAARFEHVTGVDVSPSMIREAENNCKRFGVKNIRFVRSLADVSETFDLVHSYIVLQHMPIPDGMAAMDSLISKTRSGGLCFLHFTIGWNAGTFKRFGTFCRRNLKPLHYLLNLREGKPMTEAYMRSSDYDLNRFVSRLFHRGIRRFWIESENHGGPYGVSVLFEVP